MALGNQAANEEEDCNEGMTGKVLGDHREFSLDPSYHGKFSKDFKHKATRV